MLKRIVDDFSNYGKKNIQATRNKSSSWMYGSSRAPPPEVIDQTWRGGDQFWSHWNPLCSLVVNDYRDQNGY